MYTLFVLFPVIIVAFAFITYKSYSSQYEHHNPLSIEYSLWSLPLPSCGLNGGPYSPPGFTHTCSAYNSAFWAEVVPPKVTGTISGRYRCPWRNAQLPNAKPKSYHMYSCAADITGQSYDSLKGKFVHVWNETNPVHVHIDSGVY